MGATLTCSVIDNTVPVILSKVVKMKEGNFWSAKLCLSLFFSALCSFNDETILSRF